MILAPLLDYLTFLNSWYGLAIVAAVACFLTITAIFSKTEEKISILRELLEFSLAVLGFAGLGFVWFVLYKSHAGVRYDFWPLTCSIFIALYVVFPSLIVSTTWKDGIREVVGTLAFAAIACVFFSPMMVLWVRTFENFHPLWP